MKTKIGWAKQSGGFTIVEVMIFLAISGLIFLMAVFFINGKQDRVAYEQGMQAAASSVTKVINTVANGEYPPLPDNVKCVEGPSSLSFSSSPNPPGQGSNKSCVFMGKVLQFGTNSDKTEYKTYTVAGSQFESDGITPVQSFADAKPTGIVDLTQTDALEHGLAFDKAYLCEGNCTGANVHQIGGVGFFGSFGNYNSGDASDQSSGAQSVTVVAMPTTSNMLNTINDSLKSTAPGDTSTGSPAILSNEQYIVLCFERGDKAGNVQIGGPSGQQTSVSVDFNKDKPCG